MKQGIGTYFVVAASLGYFVGMANPFLFFVGSAKAFGVVVLICCITIAMSKPFTNWLTTSILQLRFTAA